MELLEGSTLRGKLDAGPIPPRSRPWTTRCRPPEGLSAAHEKGIVHRDLKPENLFVTRDGHLKILDFGLAKKVDAVSPGEETSAPTGSGHTEPGKVMGTAGYMSPEQVRGLPLDHRSDIFAFGAILYELLSGKEGLQAATRRATPWRRSCGTSRRSCRSRDGTFRPHSTSIVRHCLEKDRDHRFQSAKDIAFALSEASGPTTAVNCGASRPRRDRPRKSDPASAAVLRRPRRRRRLSPAARSAARAGREAAASKRLAVLPFENLGAPEDDYFADGIADEIRGKLTSLPGLQVIARGSSTPYKKTSKTPRQIARRAERRTTS